MSGKIVFLIIHARIFAEKCKVDCGGTDESCIEPCIEETAAILSDCHSQCTEDPYYESCVASCSESAL